MTGNYKTKIFPLCRCCHKWHCQCLLPRRKKLHPPFNSGAKRDNKLGMHPKLKALARRPQMWVLIIPGKLIANLSSLGKSPALNLYFAKNFCDKEENSLSWMRQRETEEFSNTLGGKLLMRGDAVQRDMKIERGPGSHEISRWPENTFERPCKSLRTDANFGTAPRFLSHRKSTTPGPGYTFRTHNPYYYLDEKRSKGFSHIPPFEFDGLIPRFRETKKAWSLPCNRYNVKHPNSLQAFLEKITGKRGPYDLFTGPRDETTIKGYWTLAKLEDYDDWPRKLPCEMEKFSNRCNYFKGKWSTNPRFTKKPVVRMMLQDISTCYKDPDEPGPGHYDPREPRKSSSLKRYPFDSNIEHVRPLPPSGICPEPGRYKIKEDSRTTGHGWTCVFKSKVPRTIGFVIPSPYTDF